MKFISWLTICSEPSAEGSNSAVGDDAVISPRASWTTHFYWFPDPSEGIFTVTRNSSIDFVTITFVHLVFFSTSDHEYLWSLRMQLSA